MLFPFTAPEDTPDTLDRFMSRLLRREVFEEMSRQDYSKIEPYSMILFGSAVMQVHRPPEGYPIRRMARDIDIGYVTHDNRKSDPPQEMREEMGKHILRAIGRAGAKVVDGSIKGIPGFDGLVMEKTFSREEIEAHLEGRMEAADVRRHLGEDRDFTARLELEEMVMRSPLMHPVPFGDTGFLHANILENIGEKIARLARQDRVARDIIDIYNTTAGEHPVIDVKEHRDLLRAVAVIELKSNANRANFNWLEPTDENVERIYNRVFARHAEQREGLSPEEKADKARHDLERSKQILDHVRGVTDTLFKREIVEENEFPIHLRGELGLTKSEVRFGLHMLGVDIPDGAPSHYREQVTPSISPGLVIPSSVSSKHPEMAQNLAQKHELQAICERHLSQRMMSDF